MFQVCTEILSIYTTLESFLCVIRRRKALSTGIKIIEIERYKLNQIEVNISLFTKAIYLHPIIRKLTAHEYSIHNQ